MSKRDDNTPPNNSKIIDLDEFNEHAKLSEEQKLSLKDQAIRRFFRRHGSIIIGNMSAVARRKRYRLKKEGVYRMETQFIAEKAYLSNKRNMKVPVTRKKPNGDVENKDMKIVDFWMESLSRIDYEGVDFDPQPDMYAGSLDMPPPTALGNLNLYQGMSIKPKQGNCDPLLNHIFNVLCNGKEELFNYFMFWSARMIQMPGEIGQSILLFNSEPGAGKDIIFNIFYKIFASHAFICSSIDQITGRFNDNVGLNVFTQLNEAVYGGSKAPVGPLKMLATDEMIPSEGKFQPKVMVPNCNKLVGCSNEPWMYPVEPKDRRAIMFEVSNKYCGNGPYFQDILDCRANGGEEAFLYHLMHEVDIRDFRPSAVPNVYTGTMFNHKMKGLDSIGKWLGHVITHEEMILEEFGEDDYGRQKKIETNLIKDWSKPLVDLEATRVYKCYAQWCAKAGKFTAVEHTSSLGIALKKLLPKTSYSDGFYSEQNRRNAIKASRYYFPPVEECEKLFGESINLDVNWEDVKGEKGE